MELRSIGGPFTRSSLYFSSPKVCFPALVSQRQALGQTAAFPIKGKKICLLRHSCYLKGRAFREKNESNQESWLYPRAAAGKTLPHFAHFVCATSWFCYHYSLTQNRGMINQICLKQPCPSPVSADMMPSPLWQPRQSQHQSHSRKRTYFYLQLPSTGEVGEIPHGQPQRYLFV